MESRLPETLVSPQLLDDLIEGRLLAAPRMGEAATLARLAADCRQLRLPGPDAFAATRMRRRYAAYLSGEHSGIGRWLFGWLGAGPLARPLRERLAAGVMIVAAAGGSASYATGITPLEAAGELGRLAASIAVNLDPRDGAGGELLIDLSATPTPAGTPASTTPAPTPFAALPGAPRDSTPTANSPAETAPGPSQDTPSATPAAATSATVTPTLTPSPTSSPAVPSPGTGGAATTPPSPTPTPPPTATPTPPTSTPTVGTTPTPTKTPGATVTPPTSTPTATATSTPARPPGDDGKPEDD